MDAQCRASTPNYCKYVSNTATYLIICHRVNTNCNLFFCKFMKNQTIMNETSYNTLCERAEDNQENNVSHEPL